MDDENEDVLEELNREEPAEPERLNEHDLNKKKEKMFVEYNLEVLRVHIAEMLPLSGIERDGN